MVLPGPPAPIALACGYLLADQQHRIADPASASVLVADRYGQLLEAVYSGAAHNLPRPDEIAGWLKYLGTLCPE